MRPSVVAVVAHPDDESLIAGGTLALAARAGALTGAVALTRGELGPIGDHALATPATLGAVRERELGDAARELGLDWTACLGNPDGELAWIDADAVAAELESLLAPRAPTVLLTFGEDGVYGHPDHAAARDLAVRAADLVAAARERGLPTDLWSLEPEAFGSGERTATVAIDVVSVLDRRLRALRAHRTQLDRRHLLAALPADLAERHLGVEAWRLARPGADGAGALDELLAPYARVPASP